MKPFLLIFISPDNILQNIIFAKYCMNVKEIKALIYKDILLELKQKYAINGILLYVVSTIFVCYLAFSNGIEADTWNALFWIIMLFAAVNAVSKSFVQEHSGRQLYYYSLATPQAVIMSKIIYNGLLMIILSVISFFVFTALMGNIIENVNLFAIMVLLSSIGFSTVLTMISAIASRTNNNFALMAILSFPLMLPLLLITMKGSAAAITGESLAENVTLVMGLFFLDAIVAALSYVLFPYLWKD